jgi:two-component system nitrogen regulation sensor histidine kinase NtrY
MGFNRFGTLLTVRLALLFAVLGLAGYLLSLPGYPVVTGLVIAAAAALAWEVVRYVRRTNLEVSRFLDAARYADFGQRFEFSGFGAGFAELGDTFTSILDRFREDRKDQEAELRHLKAMLEHVPVPLITVHADNRVSLRNNAARKLFGSAQIGHLDDLASFGADLPARLKQIRPGERLLAKFQLESTEQTLAVVASEITVASRTERLVSLLNIQSELDGMQLTAWQDLVRVLTHEIMNSITPVSSLARTASDLIDDVSTRLAGDQSIIAELDDVKDAVSTVARRSDGLMSFVSSYRRLTRLPEPQKARVRLAEMLSDVRTMATVGWDAAAIRLEIAIEPPELETIADRQMISQVLINLLQNAEQALGTHGGSVTLTARLNQRGHVTIEVADDGPGIPPEVADRIFVPFFTTRKEGSGVGLALSRQIMIAHGGTISFTNRPEGGARFTLTF